MRSLLRGAGVDRPVVFAALSRVSSAGLAAAAVVVIAWRFPAEVQGYYFTFLNLLQLQTLGELGLLAVVVPFASHEWSRLVLRPEGALEGDPEARSRLSSLARFTFAWFFIAGIAVASGVGLGGALFFRSSGADGVGWAGPWMAVCLLTGVKMWFFPALGLLEGTAQVAELYFIRWVATLAFGVSLVAGVLLGLGLWAMPLGFAVETCWIGTRLLLRHRRFFGAVLRMPEGARIRWAGELLPLQLRIGASWLCGYFAFHLFTPLLFRWHGAAEAGRWGLTWSMFSVVSSVASLWITTRSAQFGIRIARRQFDELDRTFDRMLVAALVVAALGSAAVWTGIWWLSLNSPGLSSRLLPPGAAALLAASAVLMQISLGHSTYLRAHRREPFVLLSVAQAAVGAGGALLFGRTTGSAGMAASYAAGVLLVVPLGYLIWARCRRDWHAPPPEATP